VFFGRGERRLTEQVFGASHIDRVLDGPKGCGSVPETMQVDSKTEDSPGSLLHGEINRLGPHWDAVM
jgi:hypothetical protein